MNKKASNSNLDEIEDVAVLILCPYCMSPIEDNIKFCSSCGGDKTQDATIEMTVEEYQIAERTKCPFCENLILKLANPCPFCKKRRNNSEADI